MAKALKFIFLLLVFTQTGIYAQGEDDLKKKSDEKSTLVNKASKKKKSNVKRTQALPFVLKLQGNHNFYLTVDNKEYGMVLKSETRVLPLPYTKSPTIFKLSLEEADSTGEVIERYLKVTPEMTKRDTTYFIEFKKDFLEIIRSYPAIVPNQNKQQ